MLKMAGPEGQPPQGRPNVSRQGKHSVFLFLVTRKRGHGQMALPVPASFILHAAQVW
jgi:hypothetical protein